MNHSGQVQTPFLTYLRLSGLGMRLAPWIGLTESTPFHSSCPSRGKLRHRRKPFLRHCKKAIPALEFFMRSSCSFVVVNYAQMSSKYCTPKHNASTLNPQNRVGTTVSYLPRIKPETPSPLRQLAYQNGTPIPGPNHDSEGWKALTPGIVKGSVFGHREVQIKCTVICVCFNTVFRLIHMYW